MGIWLALIEGRVAFLRSCVDFGADVRANDRVSCVVL